MRVGVGGRLPHLGQGASQLGSGLGVPAGQGVRGGLARSFGGAGLQAGPFGHPGDHPLRRVGAVLGPPRRDQFVQAALDLHPAGREQPADLGVDADDLPGAAGPVEVVADAEVAFQGGLADPVVDRPGRGRHPVDGPAVQGPPLPVGAADPVERGGMGVDVHVTGPRHAMVERGGDQPGGVDLADPVVPGPGQGGLALHETASPRPRPRGGRPRSVCRPSGGAAAHSTLTDFGALNGQVEPGHRPAFPAPADRRLLGRPALVGPGPERRPLGVDPLPAGAGLEQGQFPLRPPGRLVADRGRPGPRSGGRRRCGTSAAAGPAGPR